VLKDGLKALCRTALHVPGVVTTSDYLYRQAHPASFRPGAFRDTYGYLKRQFIANGAHSAIGTPEREQIIQRFEAIDRNLKIATSATDGLILAELLINCAAPGDVVECGCFNGGSSAKLSILAELLGRRLVVCDSFEGLPDVDGYNLRDQHMRRGEGWVEDWSAGRYAARIDRVKHNIQAYGELGVCGFVKGWFADTLTPDNLPERVALAFVDVDIPSSARDCIKGLWPLMPEQSVFVSHDVAWVKVMQVFHDPELWQNHFNEFPPMFFGAGFGIYNASPHIGYAVKGQHLDPAYFKSLTIEK